MEMKPIAYKKTTPVLWYANLKLLCQFFKDGEELNEQFHTSFRYFGCEMNCAYVAITWHSNFPALKLRENLTDGGTDLDKTR